MNDDKMNRKNTFDVYVGHVPKHVQEVNIIELFSRYGEIADVFCRFGSGTYGYAIVKYWHQKDANRVLNEVRKVYIHGCEMEIKTGKKHKQSSENGDMNIHSNDTSLPEIKSSLKKGMNKTDHNGQVQEIKPNPKRCINDNDYNGQAQDLKYPLHVQKNGAARQECPIMIEVMCTNVENAVTFYGCPIYRCEELENLSLRLNNICPNLPRLLRKPSPQKIYGALFAEDMTWYRGCVIQPTIELKPGMCLVEYIDYGNVDEVSYTNIVDLPEPLKKIPPFAVKCILSNLMCNPKSNCDISYLHHLIYQRMSLCAISTWGIPEYQVLKCSCNGIDVISELVRNGFAVYRAEKFEKVSTPKSQENHKPKKGNASKHNSKKSPGAKDINNVEKNHCNGTENGSVQNAGNSKTSFSSDSQNGSSQDFVPKMIIKRPASITTKPAGPLLEDAKVKETFNKFLQVDCVISNVKLVNSVRNLVSLKCNDDVINHAFTVLQSDMDVKSSDNAKNEVEEAYGIYLNVINEIKSCTDKTLLTELKKKRDCQMSDVRNKLKTFFEKFDSSLFNKRKSIQTMITDLESNSDDWMNVFFSSKPTTVQDIMSEYDKEKKKRWNIIEKARENTDEKHKKFMDFMKDFLKEFTLNMAEEDSGLYQLGNGGKKGSWALKLEEALTDLNNALDEEMKTCKVNKGKGRVSVIQCILEMLDTPKETIDAECELFRRFHSLNMELEEMSNLNSNFEKLDALKKEIISFKSEWNQDTPKAVFNSSHLSLHDALLREDALMVSLAKASSLHFPELDSEHPELNLSEYQKNWYLWKKGWKKEYFPHFDPCVRVEPSYISMLKDDPVIVKEFQFDDESEKKSFIKNAIVWNEIKSKSLVKVKALFDQDEKTAFALLPFTWPTLFESPLAVPVDRKKACHVLQQILLGLRDIHSRGMAHGAVHPYSILHKDESILLDFCYDLKILHEKACIKGINFQVPNGEGMCKSADMYGYGCLVLWILFPNLSFTKTEEGVPNLVAFQSILKDLLCEKDFASLSALLHVNPDLRPSSRNLLSSGFLKDLRVI